MELTTGHQTAEKRQIPWKNVGCLTWIKLVTTHDESDGIYSLYIVDTEFFSLNIEGHLVAIDEISGIFDHTEDCTAQIEMDRNLHVPLHQKLHIYALSLLRKNTPLSLLCLECSQWADEKWGKQPGNIHAWFCLTIHDTSSLYHTIMAWNSTVISC